MKLVQTHDGSFTIYSNRMGECFHSINGAVTESMHVFINAGFKYSGEGPVNILEAGFGTGLNTWLTLLESLKSGRSVKYYTIELFPVDSQLLKDLNYHNFSVTRGQDKDLFYSLHNCDWGKDIKITENFVLHKINEDIKSTIFPQDIGVVYYDAFSPATQPELWSFDIFERLHQKMQPGALLTTYCVKGEIKRILRSVGFKIEKLPGPPGKREILRAQKSC
ncbi:MAG: tRNA (5-methylaminomethyl-2-thiouridine)(34)-methyltransferase MnmD [Bacteroidales bacterium]|nr:tRNA (5-methylaminomethyl-2-thiouridine)(34)-methyltransferase MnmD [Bacteroidales bacterium]